MFSYINSSNERLKNYINDELLERIDDNDIQMHFEFEETSFAQFNAIVQDSKAHVAPVDQEH